MNGRPCELTEERLAKLLELATKPVSQAAMACAVGVSPRTLLRWLAKGRKKPRTGLEAKLVRGMGKARAVLEDRLTSIILKAAEDPRQWKAAAFLLTKLFPKEWGDRVEPGEQPPMPRRDDGLDEAFASPEYIEAVSNMVAIADRMRNANRAAG